MTMAIPTLAKKVKKLATFQLFNLKLLLNGESSRGFSKFKKNYKLKGEIGRGGFGIVYRAIRIADETPVAVKFIDRRAVREWGKIGDEQVPMEICMLSRCSRIKGVIRLLDWYSIPEGYLIVMERPYPCVDMFDFIKGQGKLDEQLARFLFGQIVNTIQQCGERKVLHRDLKDENIVIDLVSGETKLIDFGAATVLKKSQYTDFQGTRLYCPPEWFLHSLYLGKEAAVWSLGVLLYNALNGRLPFRNEKDICTAHLLGPLPFYTAVSADARDLIQRCLSFDPFARCTLEDIAAHPWVCATGPEWTQLASGLDGTGSKHEENSSEDEAHASDCDDDEEEDGEHEREEQEEQKKEKAKGGRSDGGESGVGSLDGSRPGPSVGHPPVPRPRAAKTSLLSSPPTAMQLRAARDAGATATRVGAKTLSHSQATLPAPRRQPQRVAAVAAANSTVLATLRRAMSRRSIDPVPHA